MVSEFLLNHSDNVTELVDPASDEVVARVQFWPGLGKFFGSVKMRDGNYADVVATDGLFHAINETVGNLGFPDYIEDKTVSQIYQPDEAI